MSATAQTHANSTLDISALINICGEDGVLVDEADRAFHAQDLYRVGHTPVAVVKPDSADMLGEIIRWANAQGASLFTRGGGMSYTDAYQPTRAPAVTIDFSRLTNVREINVEDRYVTVEAGCTWAALDALLAEHGMRAAFWGPMSGGTATIGGGLSQGSVTFGSGHVGASANAVMGFEIVTGDGRVIHTGSDGQDGFSAFNRHYGPDLTGVFANDAGALGVKTAATLALVPRPKAVTGLSFAFDAFDPMADMVAAVTKGRLASEIISMDADVARQNAGPGGLKNDLKTAWSVFASTPNPVTGIGRLMRMAAAGRDFFEKSLYTANFVVEGVSQKHLSVLMEEIRALAGDAVETANSAALVMRAMPFPDLPVLHPDGRRLLPMHGVLPYSRVKEFHKAYVALLARYETRMKAADVTVASFFAGVTGSGLLYEPVFYWPDETGLFVDRKHPQMFKDMGETFPANEVGRALVEELKTASVDLMHEYGATHFQIGRMYPYMRGREDGASQFVRSLKNHLDPNGIINPGALGL